MDFHFLGELIVLQVLVQMQIIHLRLLHVEHIILPKRVKPPTVLFNGILETEQQALLKIHHTHTQHPELTLLV